VFDRDFDHPKDAIDRGVGESLSKSNDRGRKTLDSCAWSIVFFFCEKNQMCTSRIVARPSQNFALCCWCILLSGKKKEQPIKKCRLRGLSWSPLNQNVHTLFIT